MRKKEEITAIMDNDLEKLLVQTSQLDDFQNGEIGCCICHSQMTIDNVGIIMPVVGDDGALKLEFVCNNPNCLNSNS